MDIKPEYALTREQRENYWKEGYLGPFATCSPEEMPEKVRAVDEAIATVGPCENSKLQSRHLDKAIVWKLCSHPAVVERMAQIMGEDLILWRSNFFTKEAHDGKESPWHQDFNYWPIEPVVNLTAWLALEDVTMENSCLQIIPGSHKKFLPQVDSKEGVFGVKADLAMFDASKAIPFEMRAGEFILFNERLLHHAAANLSPRRRLALAIRVTVPFVKVAHEELFPNHKNILLRGKDNLSIN